MESTVRESRNKRLPYPKLVKHKGSKMIYYAFDESTGMPVSFEIGRFTSHLLFHQVRLQVESCYEDFEGTVTLKNTGFAFGKKDNIVRKIISEKGHEPK